MAAYAHLNGDKIFDNLHIQNKKKTPLERKVSAVINGYTVGDSVECAGKEVYVIKLCDCIFIYIYML